jgi:hypothetical protein
MQVLKNMKEVEAATKYPLELLSDVEQSVLTDVYEYYKKNPKVASAYNVEIQDKQGQTLINYTFPSIPIENEQLKSMKDLEFDMLEYYWHCPTLFSLFSPKVLFKLLTIVLLEHSVVFVHDNLAVLTSVVLAIKTLIRPFQW